MKKTIKITAWILLFSCLFSPAFANGLTVDPNGKIGIGTEEPLSELDVRGAITSGNGPGTKTYNVLNYFSGEKTQDKYIHLKLPFNPAVASDMFHITVRGYAYYSAQIIDLTYVGYAYKTSNTIKNSAIQNPSGNFSPLIYKGSDNYVYLRFKPPNLFYLTFSVDSMYVGNGRVIKPGEIEAISSTSATL